MFFGFKKSEGDKTGDWADQAASLIEGVVDNLHSKAVVPLTTAARAIVYGILAVIVGFVALILFAIFFVRFLNIYLGNIHHFASDVWLPDLSAGILFVIVGLIAWSRRYSKSR